MLFYWMTYAQDHPYRAGEIWDAMILVGVLWFVVFLVVVFEGKK